MVAYSIPMFANPADRDKWCAENADHFEMVRGGFRGTVERHKVNTLAEAREHAELDRGKLPWRVYAVMPCGSSAHICNLR